MVVGEKKKVVENFKEKTNMKNKQGKNQHQRTKGGKKHELQMGGRGKSSPWERTGVQSRKGKNIGF